jgi:hypothetical protein
MRFEGKFKLVRPSTGGGCLSIVFVVAAIVVLLVVS